MVKARDQDDLKRWASSIRVTPLSLSFPFRKKSTAHSSRIDSFPFLPTASLSKRIASKPRFRNSPPSPPFLKSLFEGHISMAMARNRSEGEPGARKFCNVRFRSCGGPRIRIEESSHARRDNRNDRYI